MITNIFLVLTLFFTLQGNQFCTVAPENNTYVVFENGQLYDARVLSRGSRFCFIAKPGAQYTAQYYPIVNGYTTIARSKPYVRYVTYIPYVIK